MATRAMRAKGIFLILEPKTGKRWSAVSSLPACSAEEAAVGPACATSVSAKTTQ